MKADREKYLQVFKENFNAAVCENEMKWYANEAEKDHVTFAVADDIVTWCEHNYITMRGTCLFWNADQYAMPWLKALEKDAMLAKVHQRLNDTLTHFHGHVAEWDVNNEMMHGHFFDERLGGDIGVKMLQWAHAVDPSVRLCVNEYDNIEGNGTADYVRQIQLLIVAGAPVGGIGCQCHYGAKLIPRR